MSTEARMRVLLRAAYDLLTKAERMGFVEEAGSIHTYYDGANCGGGCLREDIAHELDIEDDTDPLINPEGDEDE